MDREDLEWGIVNLTNRVRDINKWIMDNPQTDPNLYEMTECLMDFGNLTAMCKKFALEDAKANGDINGVDPYDIIKIPALSALSVEIRKMMKLRGVMPLDKGEKYDGFRTVDSDFGFKIIHSPFFQQNKDAANFLNDIYYMSISGSFVGEDVLGNEGFKKKKATFSKIAGVSLYLWQQSKNNVNFIYNNRSEFEFMSRGLQDVEQLYSEAGLQYYEGGTTIKNMLDSIKKYMHFDEDTDTRKKEY